MATIMEQFKAKVERFERILGYLGTGDVTSAAFAACVGTIHVLQHGKAPPNPPIWQFNQADGFHMGVGCGGVVPVLRGLAGRMFTALLADDMSRTLFCATGNGFVIMGPGGQGTHALYHGRALGGAGGRTEACWVGGGRGPAPLAADMIRLYGLEGVSGLTPNDFATYSGERKTGGGGTYTPFPSAVAKVLACQSLVLCGTGRRQDGGMFGNVPPRVAPVTCVWEAKPDMVSDVPTDVVPLAPITQETVREAMATVDVDAVVDAIKPVDDDATPDATPDALVPVGNGPQTLADMRDEIKANKRDKRRAKKLEARG